MEKGIKIKYRKGNPLVYDDAERERHEEFYFSAYDVNKEIGHLIVTKIIDPVDELEIELDNPIASFGSVNPAYRRKGIMREMIYKANDFCKQQYNKPLRSDFNNSLKSKLLWKKLENNGEAERKDYKGLEYWIMK